jgi:hypothetical protein
MLDTLPKAMTADKIRPSLSFRLTAHNAVFYRNTSSAVSLPSRWDSLSSERFPFSCCPHNHISCTCSSQCFAFGRSASHTFRPENCCSGSRRCRFCPAARACLCGVADLGSIHDATLLPSRWECQEPHQFRPLAVHPDTNASTTLSQCPASDNIHGLRFHRTVHLTAYIYRARYHFTFD